MHSLDSSSLDGTPVELPVHQLNRQPASVISALRWVASRVCVFAIAIGLAVASFGVNEAEGRLMQHLAPRGTAELSLAARSPARPTHAMCANVGRRPTGAAEPGPPRG
jgi:hypothetical protein